MASKKKLRDSDYGDVDLDFNPTVAASKLPVDVSGGKKALMEYMEIPIDLIDPYSDKQGRDFTAYKEDLSNAMLSSIKEFGVMEAITVRAKPNGRYELLAGERRWMYSKMAGLTTIPAHVIQADDEVARAVFALTNILRRPNSYHDLINGWWHFYIALKESGRLNDVRQASSAELSPEIMAEIGGDGKTLSYRQMMRYVKMYSLIDQWVDALEAKTVTLRAAEVIAGLPADLQEELLPYMKAIDEEKARQLVKLFRGEIADVTWSKDAVNQIVSGVAAKPKASPVVSPETKAFVRAKRKIVAAAQAYLRPEDYDKADSVIQAALELYYTSQKS